VIERARDRQPGLKLLLMTGDADALQSGGVVGVPLLPKPFKVAQLNERVTQTLVGARGSAPLTAEHSPTA
jgi:hypothetical protein